MTVCGIDSGLSGGIAFVGPDYAAVYDMPVVKTKGKLKYIDGHRLELLFSLYKPDVTVIERVGSMPGQGVSTTFQFGVAFGGVLTAASRASSDVVLVGPAQWKKALGIAVGASKKVSGIKASKLYPELKSELYGPRGGLKDGKAEALLLAKYATTVH